MKLAILTAQVSPYHNARYVAAARNFSELHVLSSVNAGDFPEFLATSLGDYTIHRLFNGREEYLAAVSSGELAICVSAQLAALKPDAIAVAGWAAPESLAALLYGRANAVPVIAMSESQADDAPRSLVREFVKARIVSLFDAALVGGPSHASYISSLGIPIEHIHHGYNAVDNIYFEAKACLARERAEELRDSLSLPKRYILASSRFIKKKNIPNLIRAYADARSRTPEPPDLVILGGGPELPAVQAATHACELFGHVHLPGFQPYSSLPYYYALADAFVHVPIVEQWGLVINEAMACGVPVLASRPCGAARTVIEDGVTGLLTDVDTTSISDAIVRLCGMSAQQRAVVAASGTLAIRAWGPDRFGTGLLHAVESAKQNPCRRRPAVWDRAILSHLLRQSIEDVA